MADTKTDPISILESCKKDRAMLKYEDALEKLKTLFNKLELRNSSFAGVRLTYLLQEWVELGNVYKPAIKELRLLGHLKAFDVRDGIDIVESFRELAAINYYLHQTDATVNAFTSLHSKNPKAAKLVYDLAAEFLIENKLFNICRHYVSPQADYEIYLKNFLHFKALANSLPDSQKLENYQELIFVKRIRNLVIVMFNTGQKKEAGAILDSALPHVSNRSLVIDIKNELGKVPETRAQRE